MYENGEIKKEEKERAQTSPVWSYFKVCEDNAVMADCLLCGTRMSRGGSAPNRCGTTNLRRHILYSHNIHLPSAYNKRGSPDEDSKKVLRKKQPKKLQSLKKNSSLKKSSELTRKTSLVKEGKKKKEKLKKEIVETQHQPEPVMCIKWNTYVNNMTSTLPQLLQDEQFVDVTLACEGQSLKCHKILLAACSPYFYELLSEAACKHPIIMFKDYRFWELQALVAFMYCGEVNVPQSQLPRILRVAEALQIKGLAKPATKPEPGENEFESTNGDIEHCAANDPPPTSEKRKRKPSAHNCCKNSIKGSKVKRKLNCNKPKNKLKSPKKKPVSSPAKKPRLSPEKKYTPRKPPFKRDNVETKREPSLPLSNPLEQNCSNLPELLHNDMPDMLNDILAMKDTDGITEGISLPEAHKVGSVDGIFPLEDLEGMKMDMDGDGSEIGPFLSNGLNGSDHFDLLPQINPECRLDDVDEDGR